VPLTIALGVDAFLQVASTAAAMAMLASFSVSYSFRLRPPRMCARSHSHSRSRSLSSTLRDCSCSSLAWVRYSTSAFSHSSHSLSSLISLPLISSNLRFSSSMSHMILFSPLNFILLSFLFCFDSIFLGPFLHRLKCQTAFFVLLSL